MENCYAVICPEHGKQFLTEDQYNWQMSRPDSRWECPICRELAYWDDDTFEECLDRQE